MSLAQIATSGLTFDEASHVYRLDGRAIPSVTTVIRDNRLGDDFHAVAPDVLEHARQRGTAVHAALHYWDEGTLDEATVDPVVAPYVAAWRRFVDERRVQIVAMERRHADQVYRFAGTLDRMAVVDGRRTLIDIKSGSVGGAQFQTAAYAHLAGELPSVQRWAVQLHPERAIPYTVHPYTDRSDWRIFRSALELTHERARLGRSWEIAA